MSSRPSSPEFWDVWRVPYQTYADIAARGELKRTRVARMLPLAQALELMQSLGFGHSAHHFDPRDESEIVG